MSSALASAELIDGYERMCKRDSVNAAARARCSYTIWNDQSLAIKAKAILKNSGVDVVVLNPSADGGMPHTRGNSLICIPAYHSEASLEETLNHEMVHIKQKQQPALWKMKMNNDGWTMVDETSIPEIWRRRCRINPDTFGARFFAWEGRHVPLPLFVREDRPDLRDIVVRWYDIEEGIVKSSIPTSFSKKYGNVGISSMEHPYELSAYT
jgi:hypothetical protein